MSITEYAVPNDRFEAENSTGFSFPCSACKSMHRNALTQPCCGCGHNVNANITAKSSADILAKALTFYQMAQLIVDLAKILEIEVKSNQSEAEMFAIRMVGAATMAKRHSDVVREYQNAHFTLMGV